MADALCYFDSPVYCRRERWEDGVLIQWANWDTLEMLHHAIRCAGVYVSPAWLSPWNDGQIHGDVEAMEEQTNA